MEQADDGVFRTFDEVRYAVLFHGGHNQAIKHVAVTPIREKCTAKRNAIHTWTWDERFPDPIRVTPTHKHFRCIEGLRVAAFLAKHNAALAERLYGPIGQWTFGDRITRLDFLFSDAPPSFNPDLGAWDVRNITNLQGIFRGCAGFQGTNLDKWKTTSLENASLAFEACTAFTADLSSWDVSRLCNAEMMFKNCWRFNASLAQWQTGRLRSATAMFEDCWLLEALDVSEWDVRKLKLASSMFRDAKRFRSDVSKWRLDSVLDMAELFFGCEAFDSDLGSWRCPRSAYPKNPQYDARYRKKPGDKGSALEDHHPEFLTKTDLMFDAFWGATKFSWRIPPWMIGLLNRRERGGLASKELTGEAGYLAKEAKAARRWSSLSIRLRVRTNNDERLREEAAADAPAPPAPLPRSGAEAYEYKKDFTSADQRARGKGAGRRSAPATDGGDDAEAKLWENAPTADEFRQVGTKRPREPEEPPPNVEELAELLPSARIKRTREERDRDDYEAEYGQGSWAKLSVREQEAAAKRARERKMAREGA